MLLLSDGALSLLDVCSGAAAAWSFRLLKSDYTGYCCEVRRSSDNATQNIGFVNGMIDAVSLLAFVGSGNGFVRTMYDQSGNGNNAQRTTNSKQPRIVSSGALVLGSNGKVALTYDNNAISLQFTEITNIRSVFWCINPYSLTNQIVFLLGDTSSYDFHGNDNSTYFANDGVIMYPAPLYRNGVQIYYTSSNNEDKINSLQILSVFPTTNKKANCITEDRNFGVRSLDGTAVFQELIIYSSDKSANRVDVESNMNAYYNVF